MGQFLQVNGDYNIKTADGGTITLDTGPDIGVVRVTGNLVVDGDTLTVSAENLNVQDNVIILNFGETGAGITLEYSGIQIDRGTLSQVSFLYDEASDSWMLAEGQTPGPFNYTNSNLRLRKILTNPDTDSGDLTLIGTGNGVVKVIGTNNYEQHITDDDDIPNKKYVDDAIQSNPTFQIVRGDTRIISFDVNNPLDPFLYFPPDIGPYVDQPLTSLIGFVIDDQIVAEFYPNRVEMRGLTIWNENRTELDYNIDGVIDNPILPVPNSILIQATNTDASIKLEANGTGKIEIASDIQLNYQTLGTPAIVTESVVVYSSPPDIGTTGIYFVNTNTNGEMISKNKALLFSMIF
jgi:hypothetical protein